jgi:hypothetical protein
MGKAISFFQSPAMALLFIVISSNLASYGITATPPNFKISPGMPSGPTHFFFPIADYGLVTPPKYSLIVHFPSVYL